MKDRERSSFLCILVCTHIELLSQHVTPVSAHDPCHRCVLAFTPLAPVVCKLACSCWILALSVH